MKNICSLSYLCNVECRMLLHFIFIGYHVFANVKHVQKIPNLVLYLTIKCWNKNSTHGFLEIFRCTLILSICCKLISIDRKFISFLVRIKFNFIIMSKWYWIKFAQLFHAWMICFGRLFCLLKSQTLLIAIRIYLAHCSPYSLGVDIY